jgi:hypothetical protein
MTKGRLGAAGAWATPQHLQGPQDRVRDYGLAGAADAAAEQLAPQDLPGTKGRQRAADAAVDSVGAAVPSQELRADPPVDYAGVQCVKRTTLPRYLPGAGRCVSPMLGIRSYATTCRPSDKARAGYLP